MLSPLRALTGLLLAATLLQGCVTSTLFLKKDQYLFVSSKVKGNKKVDSEQLQALQQQKPNRRVLGFTPYLWFYQLGEKLYKKEKVQAKIERIKTKYNDKIAKAGDPKGAKAQRLRTIRDNKLDKQQVVLEEGNWLMRTVGEPPSVFDPSAMALTAKEMRNFLFNKGFFEGSVSTKVDTLSRRRVTVTYNVAEGLPQRVRHIRYQAFNPTVQHIIDSLKPDAAIDSGDRYDQDKLVAERDRLDKAIRNSGYYAFSREYIFVTADTSVEDSAYGTRGIDLAYQVKNPIRGDHERYRINEVEMHISSGGGFARSDTTVKTFNGVVYHTPYRRFAERTLDSKILLRPGQFYNYDLLNRSQAQLQAMDMFRFVNFSFDTIADRSFRLNIATSRLPKYQISDEIGVLVSQGAPGPFINLGFKVRNAFNAFDIFEISARYSQEGQISVLAGTDGVYRAEEIGARATVTLPAIVFPGKTSYLANRLNPKTRLQLGYTYLNRPEYTQLITNTTLGYTISPSSKEIVGINLIDASLVNTTRLSEAFDNWLTEQSAAGNPIRQSFTRQIVTSLSGFYVYNTTSQTEKKRGIYLRVFGEWGGELPNLFAKTYIDDDGNAGRFIRSQESTVNLQVFRFSKLQADFRYYYPTSKTTLWVARINSGVATPRGDNKVLPYVKYFFSGGSNSIRAWAPRRLGPGTFNYTQTQGDQPTAGFNAEQPGEILIEANLEVRQKLIGLFEGALFADAGNVFTLKNEQARPGSQFQFGSFIPSLALGVGAGLRMDFTFLVVRLDVGVKAYDPSQAAGSRWVLGDLFKPAPYSGYQRAVLNIGIGYPF